ncbi:MAG: DUF1559 domain-containing protein [Pirellula sp.]|jgi:hypothetical protein|nr:DUF1559 domain-containing protein [Pirellula sp.]
MHSSSRTISDETLMGYILMALPEEEQSKIESIAAVDPDLESRIADLRALLSPIQESMTETFEPSGSLVSDTMSLIRDQSESFASLPPARSSVGTIGAMSAVLESANRQTKWAWIDSLVVVAAGITILCLLLPSVWFSREEARRMSCANNLRQLGEAIQGFAHGNAKNELPSIDLEGPLAFAGVYVMKLKDAQLMESPSWVWCPSDNVARLDVTIPSVSQYLQSSSAQQLSWRKTMGGSYSYSLGFIVDGTYQTPSIDESFATPVIGDTLLVTSLDTESPRAEHAISCANILFSNGSVRHVPLNNKGVSELLDHPYLNRRQYRSAGIGRDDSCLAPSHFAPIMPVVFGRE